MARSAGTNPIRDYWDRLHGLPGGPLLFSLLLGRLAPYTGSISPRVVTLQKGFARVAIDDKRKVRNHLRSIHAIALMNLAEVTTGLALHYGLPDHARAILTRLEIDFVKKARGRLVAEATAPIPKGLESEELRLTAAVTDESGEPVATATAYWLVGPRPS